MYESPITQIMGEMQISYENECLRAVQRSGFDVNKEELTKALQYDRGQYEKGYGDGYLKAVENFEYEVKKLVAMWYVKCPFGFGDIDEIVERLKESKA